MPNKKGLATKKEINRMKKADLIKLITAKGLPCNKKMSKANLVACVFKHKELRRDFVIPAKRKLSEKQMANLQKFKIGGKAHKDYKNEKLIKPKSTYIADLGTLEDNHVLEQKSESHMSEVKRDNNVLGRLEQVRKKEHTDSTTKLDDIIKQRVEAELRKRNKQRLQISEGNARHRRDVRFGEGSAPPGFDISTLLDKNGNLDPKRVQQVKAQLTKNDPTNPLLNTIIMLELLQQRHQERGNERGNEQDDDAEFQALIDSIEEPEELDNWIASLEEDQPDIVIRDEEEEKGQQAGLDNLQTIVDNMNNNDTFNNYKVLVAGGSVMGEEGSDRELFRLLRIKLIKAGVIDPSNLPISKPSRAVKSQSAKPQIGNMNSLRNAARQRQEVNDIRQAK